MEQKQKEVHVYERYIKSVIDKKKGVSVYLITGIRLEGTVVAFDDVCLLMKGDSQTNGDDMLVMRDSVASIVI